MEQDSARRIAEAIELFDKQQYQEAFSAFTEMYHASRSAGDKQEIFQLLLIKKLDGLSDAPGSVLIHGTSSHSG